MDLVHMYEHYRTVIGIEDCNRLLAVARPPAAAPAAPGGLAAAGGTAGV